MSAIFNFTNKVILITGGASGIGLATVKKFLQSGAKVAFADLRKSEKVIDSLNQDGFSNKVISLQADISKFEDNQRIVDETVKNFGKLDYVFACAGIAVPKTATEQTFDEWQKVVGVNLSAVYALNKVASEHWIKNNRGGVIVNAGSIHSFVGRATLSSYAAAKGGVKLLTQNMAIEYASKGIRTNAVCPGYIDTPLLDPLTKEERAWLTGLHPVGRLGKPEEIADMVAYLCSDGAAFINGASFVVDGGYTAQ